MTRQNNSITVRYAESLVEIYRHIEDINREMNADNEAKYHRTRMWFRGNTKVDYNLVPGIFRDTEYKFNANQTYSNNHLRAEYRLQSFMSRSYGDMNYRMPESMIEWQEVMQHFSAKTRFMDWSESLSVALEFALKAFIIPFQDIEIKRQQKESDPVIWILNPSGLNKRVCESLIAQDSDGFSLIKKTLPDREADLAEKIGKELSDKSKDDIYYNLIQKQEENMNGMISLSSLEIIRNTFKGRELEAVRTFEMNPYVYLFLRYFADGVAVEFGKLPPLSIIHPYHSQRIKIQKGVFTVFPYYIPDAELMKIKEITGEMPAIGMEYMSQCTPYLYKVHITDPKRVANELLMTGSKRSNIYPELEAIVQDIENVISW